MLPYVGGSSRPDALYRAPSGCQVLDLSYQAALHLRTHNRTVYVVLSNCGPTLHRVLVGPVAQCGQVVEQRGQLLP